MVYSADGIPGTEAVVAQRRLASMLCNKLKRGYLEMCGFVRASISLAMLRYNTFLLRGARYKEAYIRQRPDLAYGGVMALLAPWRGQGAQRIGIQRLENQEADGQLGRREST